VNVDIIEEPRGIPSASGFRRAPPTLYDSVGRANIRSAAEPAEIVVRPALAVLFRLAVGASAADYYVPRFLAYERAGHARPSWHWPALLFAPIWAFYRRLWAAGFCYALLPLLGAVGFAFIAPRLEYSTIHWFVYAALLIWVVPSLIAALSANPLLYRRVRRLVQRAERESKGPSQAASWFGMRRPTSSWGALLCGGVLVAIVLAAIFPQLRSAYIERMARTKIENSLATVRWLELRVEEAWLRHQPFSRLVNETGLVFRSGATLLQRVDVNDTDGRLRLDLDQTLPELAGKAILLAPALDLAGGVRWFCIPVDIPERFLPVQCRSRSLESDLLLRWHDGLRSTAATLRTNLERLYAVARRELSRPI